MFFHHITVLQHSRTDRNGINGVGCRKLCLPILPENNIFTDDYLMKTGLEFQLFVTCLQSAEILFFVIDNQTRSLASIIEAAYLAGMLTFDVAVVTASLLILC